MLLKPDQERVKTLLKDTMTLLCKNGLEFDCKFRIEALVGVTLDDKSVFLMNFDELVESDRADGMEESPSDEDEKSPSKRRRKKIKQENDKSVNSDTDNDDFMSSTGNDIAGDPCNSSMHPPQQGVKRKHADFDPEVVVIKEEHSAMSNQSQDYGVQDHDGSFASSSDVAQDMVGSPDGVVWSPMSSASQGMAGGYSRTATVTSSSADSGPLIAGDNSQQKKLLTMKKLFLRPAKQVIKKEVKEENRPRGSSLLKHERGTDGEGGTYEIVKGGSQQGKDLMVDSLGFCYTFRAYQKGERKRWICCRRNNKIHCSAMVHQVGDRIFPGPKKHIHPPDPHSLKKLRLKTKVMSRVVDDLNTPIQSIIDDILKSERKQFDESLPPTVSLVKAADRIRKKVKGVLHVKPEKKEGQEGEEGILIETGLLDDTIQAEDNAAAANIVSVQREGELIATIEDTETSGQSSEQAANTLATGKVMYQIIQGGSARGKDKLIDSLGYSYCLKRMIGDKHTWLCGVRNSSYSCPARVIQIGSKMYRGVKAHVHPPNPKSVRRIKTNVMIRSQMDEDLAQPVRDVVNTILPAPQGQKISALPELAKQRENIRRRTHRLKKKMGFYESKLMGTVEVDEVTKEEAHEVVASVAQDEGVTQTLYVQEEGVGEHYEIRSEDMQIFDHQYMATGDDGTLYVYMA